MDPLYHTLRTELRAINTLEKVASCEDAGLAADAQPALAEACDALFNRVKEASLRGKQEPALAVIDLMMELRDSHQIVGQKTAASKEQLFVLAEKLATAVFVDGVLEAQYEKQSAQERVATRQVQLLGREYAVNLMQGFLE